MRSGSRLQAALECSDELLDGLFGVAHAVGDLAAVVSLGDELHQAERAPVEAVVLSCVAFGSDPKPGCGRLNGRVQLRDRHRFPVDHAGHVISLCDAAWTVRVVAADDDRARERVAARGLARDDREISVERVELIGACRTHLDPRRLLKTRHEPAPQYLVLLYDRDPNLAAGSLRAPAEGWAFRANGQMSMVIDVRNFRTTFARRFDSFPSSAGPYDGDGPVADVLQASIKR
jgi:hypothetical protein